MESSPLKKGQFLYNKLKQVSNNVFLIFDISLAYYMEKVNYVILGAQVITENGGIIGDIGNYTIVSCAKQL